MKVISILIVITALTTHASAKIETDGSLGAAINLTGPNFEIGSALGQQHGGNLFHSFSEFSIGEGEVANFTGPSTVNNIISRVSSNSVSNINGTIRSSIADVDLYLINPNGVIFGKDAQLDIQGSFSATTADNIKFSDGGVFSATPISSDILTIAPIASFGFLNPSQGSIKSQAESLMMSSGSNFNLVGGDIEISLDQSGRDGIRTSSGDINIVSSAGESNIVITNGIPALGDQAGGNIILSGNSHLSTISNGSDSAGDIRLSARNVILTNKAKISSETHGVGNAGDILIKINNLFMEGTTSLSTSTFSSGNAGLVILDVNNASLKDDALISSATLSSGNAGEITINASESLSLVGNTVIKATSNIGATGNTGDITLNTNTLSLLNGATVNITNSGTGSVGNIDITASTGLTSNAGSIYSEAATENTSTIILRGLSIIDLRDSQITISKAGGNGNAGTILVSAVDILVINNTDIRAETILFDFPVLLSGEILLNKELNLSSANEIKDPCSVVIAEEESSLSIKKSIESHPRCEK